MGKSTIEWCDYSWTAWNGCTRYAPGCQNCWAEEMAARFKTAVWGPNGTRVKTSDANWAKPLAWNRKAEKEGTRFKVFASSNSDVFEDWKGDILDSRGQQLWECCNCEFIAAYEPTKTLRQQGLQDCCECSVGPDFVSLGMKSLRARLFKLIDATPYLDWLILTKRPENIRRMYVPHCLENVPGHVRQNEGDGKRVRQRDNAWLLTSIANQEDADRNISLLLKCRDLSPVLGVSYEPALGPVDFTYAGLPITCPDCGGTGELPPTHDLHGSQTNECDDDGEPCSDCITCPQDRGVVHGLDWGICGCESGQNRRPFKQEWAESFVEQFNAADSAAFVKQLIVNGKVSTDVETFPEHLRVRQFPSVQEAR